MFDCSSLKVMIFFY